MNIGPEGSPPVVPLDNTALLQEAAEGAVQISHGVREKVDQIERDRQVTEGVIYAQKLQEALNVYNVHLGEYLNVLLESGELEANPQLDFGVAGHGYDLYAIMLELYKVLDQNTDYSGSDERVVDDVPLHEIEGIDISILGVSVVVPRDLDADLDNLVTVRLEDLDDVRLNELGRITTLIGEDTSLERAFNMQTSGSEDLNYDPIFNEEA